MHKREGTIVGSDWRTIAWPGCDDRLLFASGRKGRAKLIGVLENEPLVRIGRHEDNGAGRLVAACCVVELPS
eukprot:6758332-Prymnesium_polylepis.1